MLTDTNSVLFYSGFKSSNSMLVVTREDVYFLTNPLYFAGAKAFLANAVINILEITRSEKWHRIFNETKGKKVGILFGKTTAVEYTLWQTEAGIEFVDIRAQEAVIRANKTADEIAAAKVVASIADQALQQVLPQLRPGITEKEFAWQLEKAGRDLGADGLAFDTVCSFGKNSAVPHHYAGDTKLEHNMPILLDWGFLKDGFNSDCTRCFFYGTPSEKWLKRQGLNVSHPVSRLLPCIPPPKAICQSQSPIVTVMALVSMFTNTRAFILLQPLLLFSKIWLSPLSPGFTTKTNLVFVLKICSW